jgi:hypothetical protein
MFDVRIVVKTHLEGSSSSTTCRFFNKVVVELFPWVLIAVGVNACVVEVNMHCLTSKRCF